MDDIDLEYVKKLEEQIENLEDENDKLRESLRKFEKPDITLSSENEDTLTCSVSGNISNWVNGGSGQPNFVTFNYDDDICKKLQIGNYMDDDKSSLSVTKDDIDDITRRLDVLENQKGIFTKIKNLFRSKHEKN